MSTELTPKREAFALKYVELNNASDAYRFAFNCENMVANSIHVNASKLLNDAKVALRIKQLKEAHAKRHELTIDDLVKELQEARELALQEAQPSAMVSATMGKAKILGLIVDKQQTSGEISHVVRVVFDD